MDKEKSSSRRHRESHHRDRDEDDYHRRHRSSRHRDDSDGDDHHRSNDRHLRSSREYSVERERSSERRSDREGSYEKEDLRERKHRSQKRKDRAESEDLSDEGEKRARVLDDKEKEKRRFVDKNGTNSSPANGAGRTSRTVTETSSSSSSSIASNTKVSSISTTNENKGVNIIRSDAVPGKSSTDVTVSDAGKIGGLSLDALTKARKALQMQRDLTEKLKKIPLLNKVSEQKEDYKVVPPSGLPHLPELTAQKYEAIKRAQELAASMGFRQDPNFGPLINMFPGQIAPDITIQPKPDKTPVLRLDALGREVDEHGNPINANKVNNLSTLKVNINKQKKDAFQILKPELEVDPEKNPHFDVNMGIDKTKLLRQKRLDFLFVEEGKWSKDAETIKLNSQFGEARAKELKAKQAQFAKAKSEPDINPNLIEVAERIFPKEKIKEPIPDIEWWDATLLRNGNYGEIVEKNVIEDTVVKFDKITIYVEHPRPIEPPAEAPPPPPQPLKLTKKEQKKLRTQRRLSREKDRQELIRQGLLEPPKPKVKMSNLMKVLGAEATQDPTKLEMEIRSAAAEREQAHIDRNIARKLTPAERREKKERKLFDDLNANVETIVSVYKINSLSHPQTRFKVDVNAQENRLTGCAVISEGISVVVVEGGNKSIKRYSKLMLRRIDWSVAVNNEDEDEMVDDNNKEVNKCVLVWQGSVAKSSFNRFYVHECRTDSAARKIFADAGVAHYWDLALNFVDDDQI